MKKILFSSILTVAVLSFSSCNKDVILKKDVQNGKPVTFSTYVTRGIETRGAITTNDNLKDLDMGVFGYYTASENMSSSALPNFMYNQFVDYDGSEWKYSPLKYWPATSGDKVSFFAYSPYNTTSNCIVPSGNADKGYPRLAYTLTAKAEDMVDIVTDVQLNKISGTVEFTLDHVMARVNITASLDHTINTSETAVIITGAKLKGEQIYKNGTYTFPSDESSLGSWEPGEAYKTTSYDLSTILDTRTASHGNYSNAAGILVNTSEPETTPVFKNNEYAFLIPVTAGVTAGEAVLVLSYDVVTKDTTVESGYVKTSATREISLTAETLKPGQSYNYNVLFTFESVKISAKVKDWAPENDSDVF